MIEVAPVEVVEIAPEPVAAPEPQPEPALPMVIEPAVPPRPSLFIVHITPELAAVAKVGGLGDVVFGLQSGISNSWQSR